MSTESCEEGILSLQVENLQTRNLIHTEIVEDKERCNEVIQRVDDVFKENYKPNERPTETKVSPDYVKKAGERQENGSRDISINVEAQLGGEDINVLSTGYIKQPDPSVPPFGKENTGKYIFTEETPESVPPRDLHFQSNVPHRQPLMEKEEQIINPPNSNRENDIPDNTNFLSNGAFNTLLNGTNQPLNYHLSPTSEVTKPEKGEQDLPHRRSNENSLPIDPILTAHAISSKVNLPFAGDRVPQKVPQNAESLLISRFYYEESRPLRRCGSFPDIVENGVRENWSQPNFDNLFPIYRLSLRLSECLSSTKEIPNADTHGQYEKAGYLQKMNGRGGFPYLSQWKRRYCILSKGRLFLYEKETSKGSDKSTNVVDLKYFDHVAEAHQKESKKVSNVFVVTSQDRTFFDPGRHLFAADTLTEMHDWVNKLRESIELIRNNNRPKNAGKRHHKDTKVQIKEPEPPVKQESTEQGEKSEPASKEDDTIDAKPLLIKMTEKKREEFVSALELKLRKESEEVQRSLKETAESQVGDRQEVQENQVGSNCSDKRSSSKIITSLQIPAFDIDACPQLESVTKNRIRGPAGRRAPQTKRNAMIKDRTNSMSTLQYDGQLENPSRQEEPLEFSPARREDEQSSTDMNSLSTSQPILTYHYSSDEDSPTEGGFIRLERSFGMSASATVSSNPNVIPSKPPKSTSFNIEEVPHHPVKGLRVYFSQEGGETLKATKYNFSPMEKGDDGLLEYRSLPRSLGKIPTANVLSTERNMPYSRRGEAPSGTLALNPHNSSVGRLSSGRASPEMDALDNLLMKRSLFSMSRSQREPSGSDQDGSDASTCKAAPPDKEGGIAIKAPHDRELAKALQQFSSVLQHLQHHTAELEGRTRQIESEFSVSKNDVIHLQDATDGIRKEVKKLTETINLVNQEASKAKKEHILQKQEAERLQKNASEALLQARQSQAQFEAAKKNYESTIRDLHSLITSIRSSIIMTGDEDLGSIKKIVPSSEGRMKNSEGKSRPNSDSVPSDVNSQSELSKKATPCEGTTSQQRSGYQSFFQRPSNLIYGLTAKSTNKINKKDKDANKRKTEDKKRSDKQTDGLEKKNKIEKQSQMYPEKGGKSGKPTSRGDNSKQTEEIKDTAGDAFASPDRFSGTKRNYSGFSTENLPMMDECNDHEVKTSSEGYGISHLTINLNTAQQSSYNLEKSRSSPTISTKFANKRPNTLHLDKNQSHSYPSSPDSPISSTIPPISPLSDMNASSQMASPVFRQSSMPSVPEEISIRSRPKVFAIARQKSSPNLPIQRQNSAPIFPLQRQRSLGTVPEEGQLPRQASLMSVPEERPIVDRTLPLSPTSSMLSFALSPSASGDTLDSFRERSAFRNSMELVTGPVLAGSSMQECGTRSLSPSSEFEMEQLPIATSSLKKLNRRKKESMGPVVV